MNIKSRLFKANGSVLVCGAKSNRNNFSLLSNNCLVLYELLMPCYCLIRNRSNFSRNNLKYQNVLSLPEHKLPHGNVGVIQIFCYCGIRACHSIQFSVGLRVLSDGLVYSFWRSMKKNCLNPPKLSCGFKGSTQWQNNDFLTSKNTLFVVENSVESAWSIWVLRYCKKYDVLFCFFEPVSRCPSFNFWN